MKNCAFIGDKDMIERVFGKENLEKMKNRGMDIKTVLTAENLPQNKDKALKTEYLFSTWGMPELKGEKIKEFFPSLKAVFYAAGSVQGFAPAFLSCNVRVFSGWGANAVPVSECAAAEILLANKGFFGSNERYKEKREKNYANEYAMRFPGNFKTKVGIIGTGMVGRGVIEILKRHSLEILVYDPFLSEEQAKKMGVKKVSLEEMFRECQTISNHMPDKKETAGVLNYSLFSLMKKNATFINTGRGRQVNEEDLIRALKEEKERHAVLDVTDPEPPSKDSGLYELDNVILTPHITGSFSNEWNRMADYMLFEFDNLKSLKETHYEITADMLKRMA